MNTDAIWDHDRAICEALDGARLAQERVDAIAEALRERDRRVGWLQAEAKQARREASDLRIHLRDRDAHIRNLEAQLRPYITAGVGHGGNQEAIL